MKMRAVIIDDESDVRFLTKNLLETHFTNEITLMGEADDVEEGIKLIKDIDPDIVFLDIQLKKGTGFDILSQIESKTFEVVFITAYDQYAIKAFQFSGFGYLLKPVKLSELKDIVSRASQLFKKLKSPNDSRLKVLINHYDNPAGVKRIVLTNMSGFEVVNLSDILRLESENNYTHFFINGRKKVTSSKTLKEYEELLDEHGFYRTHQRHIINLQFVKNYEKGDGGAIVLTDGSVLPLSRNRKNGFLRRFL